VLPTAPPWGRLVYNSLPTASRGRLTFN